MTLYKWGFDMVGVNNVDALSWRMPGPDAVILREEEDARPPEFYFSSQHLNDLATDEEVCARARQIKELFDGALILEHGFGYRPEPMRGLWAMNHFSSRGVPEPALGVSRYSRSHCAKPLTRDEQAIIEKSFVDAALYAARTDSVLVDILQRLGIHGVTWTNLFALTDTMKTNGFNEDKIRQAAGVSKAEYNLFTHTANSAAVLGPYARHGQKKEAPPKSPMTLERAANIVLLAARTFVEKRSRRAMSWMKIQETTLDGNALPLPVQAAPTPSRPPPIKLAADEEAIDDLAPSEINATWAGKAVAVLGSVALAVLIWRRRRR